MRLRQTQTEKAAIAAHHAHGTGLSATSLAEGDDLNRSRYFSLKAGSEMTAIIEADRTNTTTEQLSKGRDPVWLCERLGIIQREAKRARARAVYRSAQDALGLIQRCNVHMPIDWTRVDGRLFVLNKLLGQYEAGLLDVETEIRLVNPAGLTGEIMSVEQTHTCAKHTLDTLLPHASEQERFALSRLMDVDLTPVLEIETDVAADLTTDTNNIALPAQSVSVDRIEWIMPGLVQKLLEFGRDYEKIFSVSHSLDDVLIDAGSADTVKARLFERLSDLIASNLPLQGVGRLDICASDNELLISGSGFDAFAIPLTERVEETLETIARDIDAGPVTPPRPPMITDDTEGELRAQLAALMDGGLANFNGVDS